MGASPARPGGALPGRWPGVEGVPDRASAGSSPAGVRSGNEPLAGRRFDDLRQPSGTAEQTTPIKIRQVRRVRRSCGIRTTSESSPGKFSRAPVD